MAEHVRTHVVFRRNARGGRSAAEHLIAALRCLYLPSTRRAVADNRLAEINHTAAATGNDPALDTLTPTLTNVLATALQLFWVTT
ncbi:hypothetical protein GCM10025762_13960 [Haloechinothrix salitolerans]